MARGSIFGSSFKGIDAFGKTLDDVKVKTRTGALLTIMSMGAILLMIINEFIDYRHVFLDTSVIVDKTRGSRVTLNFNMTFPRVPCYLLSLDVTDISGEHLRDISHHVIKTRLDNRMVPIPDLPTVFNSDLNSDLAKATSNKRQGYCGSCYGGLEPESGCCNTCEDVRQAYVNKGWSFGNPEAIDQCVNEGWVEKLQAQKDEACNVAGRIRIHKVMSTLQISPGRSFQTNAMHMHDIVPYLKDGMNHHFGHVIHKFQFTSDDEYSEDRAQKAKDLKKRLGAEINPLDGVVGNAHMDKGKFMFQYFVKVVSTAFHTLANERISTQQYSVTNFQRNLEESERGQNPDGTAFMHGTDALLGVFFNIEISPMLVMHTEKRHTLATFLTGVCAIVGGVLTVAGLLDAAVFQSLKSLTGSGN